MLPCLTHISMVWRNARRIWTLTCHPAKTPVRWMHHSADWRWTYKWTRCVADKATVPYKPHGCSSEDHCLEVLHTVFHFGIAMCLSKEINVVYFHQSNARARALACSHCSFMFVLFLSCLPAWENSRWREAADQFCCRFILLKLNAASV